MEADRIRLLSFRFRPNRNDGANARGHLNLRARGKEMNMAKPIRAKFPTSFGVFSPTGHVVMAFVNEKNTENARQALLDGGFSETDITRYNKEDVIRECEKSNEQAGNPVQIGQEVAKIAEYTALAKEGCGFLVVYAPEDAQTKQALAIVHPHGLKFAEKYNRLTLEELA
jgi:hypothetical protein